MFSLLPKREIERIVTGDVTYLEDWSPNRFQDIEDDIPLSPCEINLLARCVIRYNNILMPPINTYNMSTIFKEIINAKAHDGCKLIFIENSSISAILDVPPNNEPEYINFTSKITYCGCQVTVQELIHRLQKFAKPTDLVCINSDYEIIAWDYLSQQESK